MKLLERFQPMIGGKVVPTYKIDDLLNGYDPKEEKDPWPNELGRPVGEELF